MRRTLRVAANLGSVRKATMPCRSGGSRGGVSGSYMERSIIVIVALNRVPVEHIKELLNAVAVSVRILDCESAHDLGQARQQANIPNVTRLEARVTPHSRALYSRLR